MCQSRLGFPSELGVSGGGGFGASSVETNRREAGTPGSSAFLRRFFLLGRLPLPQVNAVASSERPSSLKAVKLSFFLMMLLDGS